MERKGEELEAATRVVKKGEKQVGKEKSRKKRGGSSTNDVWTVDNVK